MRKARGVALWLVAAATAFVVALFSFTPVGVDFEERVSLSWLFRVRGPIEPPPEVVIVALNKQSADYLDLPADVRAWPRSRHAELIHNLVQAGASAIVFDVAFKDPRSREEDDELAAAIASARRVLLYEWREQRLVGSHKAEEVIPPLPIFAKAAVGVAPFPIPRIPARVSQVWAFYGTSTGSYAPTLASMALQLHGRKVYETLIQLFEEARLEIGGTAIKSWPDLQSSEWTNEIVRDLRTAFKHNPQLTRAIKENLEGRIKSSTLPNNNQNNLVAALIRLYEGSDSFYLNFYGRPGTILTIPYHSLVGRGTSPASIRDFDLNRKVVFVGYSELLEPSKEDGYDTVFSRSDGVQLSGVEIIATAFANLLTGTTVKPADPLIAGPIVFALGVAAFLAAYFLPPAIGLILALGLAAVHAITAQLLFNWHGIWMPLAAPFLIQMPLLLTLGLLAQGRFARRRSERLQRAVSHYVPARAARELIANRSDSVAISQTVDAVCLTASANNFATVLEGMMPQAAADYLNAYFEALAEPLTRHPADVTEFRSDGTLCAWTCPHLDEAVRSRACLAALETLDAVDRFNGRNAPLHLDVRLGMHAGQVFIGNAGAGGQLRYGIVGDVVTTADRIGRFNEELGTRLLAAELVVEGLEDLLVRPLGEVQLTGRQSPVALVEILAAAERAAMAQISLSGRFAKGLQAFREQCWTEAIERFESILKDYPNDGPSRYFLSRCTNLANSSPT